MQGIMFCFVLLVSTVGAVAVIQEVKMRENVENVKQAATAGLELYTRQECTSRIIGKVFRLDSPLFD